MKKLTIPDSVYHIGNRAFEGCLYLEQIELPAKISIINDHTFSGCQSLKHIVIPESVSLIGRQAFAGCTDLTSIIIPESVREIESRAFIDCINLCTADLSGNHRLKSYFPLQTAIFSHRSCLRKNLHPFEKIIHPPSVAIDGKIRYIYSRHRTVIA